MYLHSVDPHGTKLRNRTGALNVWYTCSMHVWHTDTFSYAARVTACEEHRNSNPWPVPCRLNWLNSFHCYIQKWNCLYHCCSV